MVAGDDGAHFVARGMRARGFFETPRRRNHKLIRRKTNSAGKAFTRFGNGFVKGGRAAPRSDASACAGLSTSTISHFSVEPTSVTPSWLPRST